MMNKLLKYSVTFCVSACSLGAYAGGFDFFAQELVWNMSQQTASLWSEVLPLAGAPDAHRTSFNPKNVNFNWQKGFRGGVGYDSANHYWNTKLAWTYFPASVTSNHRASAQAIFPEFFSGFLSQDYFFGADISWQSNMNMFDLNTSHDFNVNDSFILSPSFGVKAGTINQTINAKWDAVTYVANENVTHYYRAIGPSLGLGARWNVYDNFNVIGNLTTAFMYGNWNINDKYIRPASLLTTPTTITTHMNHSKLGTLMLDYLVGIEWRYKGRSEIALNLGYEMQYWANQLRMPTFQILPVRGDMTIQGATCGISINL